MYIHANPIKAHEDFDLLYLKFFGTNAWRHNTTALNHRYRFSNFLGWAVSLGSLRLLSKCLTFIAKPKNEADL